MKTKPMIVLCTHPNLCMLIVSICLVSSSTCQVSSLNSLRGIFSSHCDSEIDPCFNISGCPQKTKVLYIQGFVPIDNNVFTAAESLIPAAWVAIDDVNWDCTILPNHLLQLDFVDTKCDPAEASYQAIKSVEDHENQKVLFFLGGACSLETEPLATIAGHFYKIPTVSYGASSPSLSNRRLFPNFFRTIPSEIQANSARFALMKRYNWTKIATLHETESLFSLAVEDFHRQYGRLYGQNNGLVIRSFTDTPEVQLQQIKDADIRIIMGYFYEDKAIATLCLAYHMKLTTPSHVWVLPAWYTKGWYYTDYHSNATGVSCTKEELKDAVKYSFYLDSYNESNIATNTGSTNSTEEFIIKLNHYLDQFKTHPFTQGLVTSKLDAHLYSGFTYDAVWTIAYALDNTENELLRRGSDLTLDNFDYFEANNIYSIIVKHLAMTNFSGVSGPVLFDMNGTRTGLTGIYQLREKPNNPSELAQVLIAVYYPGMREEEITNYDFDYLDGLDPVCKPTKMMARTGLMIFHNKGKGESLQAPRDRKIPQSVYVNRSLVISGYTYAFIGIIGAVLLFTFNLAASWKPLIKNSAPLMNSTVIFGCIVTMVGSLLLGFDSSNPANDFLNHSQFAAICSLRLWILTLGFTLSLGALLAKAFQIFHVHINTELKKKPVRMWKFTTMVIVFLLMDVVYLTFWTNLYPFRRTLVAIDDNKQDRTFVYEICDCDHFGFLIGALYVYKGLFTICSLLLAYESRNVKYFYINDSRFVSTTIYIAVILVGIGAPLSLVLAVHYFISAAYAVAVFTIITACISSLLMLGIPKLYYMIKGEDLTNFDDEEFDSGGPRQSEIGTANATPVQIDAEFDATECEDQNDIVSDRRVNDSQKVRNKVVDKKLPHPNDEL